MCVEELRAHAWDWGGEMGGENSWLNKFLCLTTSELQRTGKKLLAIAETVPMQSQRARARAQVSYKTNIKRKLHQCAATSMDVSDAPPHGQLHTLYFKIKRRAERDRGEENLLGVPRGGVKAESCF